MEDLELAKNGNQEAFQRVIEKVKLKLYKTGMSILKNDDDVCDALQETLLSIYQNLNRLEHLEFFQTWAIRILIHKCYDMMRRNKKVTYLSEKMQIEGNTYYEMYLNESQLEQVLDKIDEDLKLVVVLFYYDDLKVNEIAELLNIPEGTVKSRLSRARTKLYEILKREEGE